MALMASGYTIQVKGLDKLQAVFKDLPKQVQSGVQNEFRAIGEEWVGAAKRDVPVDRGTLKGSISYRVNDLRLEVMAQNEYAAYQEFGTKGKFKAPAVLGSYPSEFKGSGASSADPLTAITAWVKRKGIVGTYSIKTRRRTSNSDSQARSLAYLIFRKQMKEGMKPHPYLFTSSDGADRIGHFVDKIRKNIAAVLQQIV